jgi:ferredoxin-NADP reductase
MCAGAAAQDKEAGVVHINAVRKPEMHAYRAIVAGLDNSWSNDAIVEVAFAPPAGSTQTNPSSKASEP